MIRTIVRYWFKGILAIGFAVLMFYLGGVALELYTSSLLVRQISIVALVSVVAIVIGGCIESSGSNIPDDDDDVAPNFTTPIGN